MDKEKHRQERVREWDVGKENLDKQRSKSGDNEKRHRSRRTRSPTNGMQCVNINVTIQLHFIYLFIYCIN